MQFEADRLEDSGHHIPGGNIDRIKPCTSRISRTYQAAQRPTAPQIRGMAMAVYAQAISTSVTRVCAFRFLHRNRASASGIVLVVVGTHQLLLVLYTRQQALLLYRQIVGRTGRRRTVCSSAARRRRPGRERKAGRAAPTPRWSQQGEPGRRQWSPSPAWPAHPDGPPPHSRGAPYSRDPDRRSRRAARPWLARVGGSCQHTVARQARKDRPSNRWGAPRAEPG